MKSTVVPGQSPTPREFQADRTNRGQQQTKTAKSIETCFVISQSGIVNGCRKNNFVVPKKINKRFERILTSNYFGSFFLGVWEQTTVVNFFFFVFFFFNFFQKSCFLHCVNCVNLDDESERR
jgi:hypothetical protein